MADETNNPAGATATRSVLENPEKTLAPTTQDASAPASVNLATAVPPATGCAGEAIKGDSKAKEALSERNEPANDIEKKIRRSERFGVPLQLSEQEKRNSRAERFGTVLGSGALNSSEELKRKSRAERFGLEANSNTAVNDEEKKKARLARFSSNTKLDTQEEEKRKARALRFAQSPADSQTYTNCKGTIELATQKTAVIGSTTGGI